jgi:ketosteroid isomerase-like protein
MAAGDAELIRAVFAQSSGGDVGAVFRVADPDVRVVPRPAEPDAAAEYRGLDELMDYLVNWYSQWEEYEVEPVEIIDAGEQVLAVVRERGRLEGSGLEVEEDFSHSFRLRAGKIVEWQMYDSNAEAREAVGLDP